MKIDLSKSLREWQKEYIRNKKRFNVLVVHRRAGKTVGAVLDIIIVMMQERGDYGYICPTYRQAKKIAWRLIQKFGDQIGGFNYNSSELIVSFTNGSTLSLFGAENPDSLRGLDLRGVIFDEYAQQPSSIYGEIVFPMINANGGWVTWIGTPKGKNSFYQLYKRALNDERFYTALLTYHDTKLLNAEQIADARAEMTEEEFAQEYLCSWDASIKGAVYGKELQLAHAEGRVKANIYDPAIEVTTFWDLGISDAMSILFVQTVGKEIRIVDRYSNTGYGFEHYSEVLKQKGYKYKEHWFPHDIRHRELATGTSRIETAIKLMGNICKIVPMNTIESGINATRMIFKYLWIDESLDEYLNNISLYQYEMDEKLGIFKKQPKHDFTSHDCFVAGTKIHTTRGIVNIEEVTQEDYVLTANGFRKVLVSIPTKVSQVTTYLLNNGENITCTPEHPFRSNLKYIPIDTLSYLDTIDSITFNSTVLWNRLNLIEGLIGFIKGKNTIQTVTEKDCIQIYGERIFEKYKNDFKYTIKIEILSIITWIILKLLMGKNIAECICSKNGKIHIFGKYLKIDLNKQESQQKYGIDPKRVLNGIKNNINKAKIGFTNKLNITALNAERNTKTVEKHQQNIVQTDARQKIGLKVTLIILNFLVVCVEVFLLKTNISKNQPALKIVGKQKEKEQLVYNLSVSGEHNYYANGCLVHNCDATRYMSTVYEHIIKAPKSETPREEMHEMDLLIFGDDEPDEEDEQLLDTAY